MNKTKKREYHLTCDLVHNCSRVVPKRWYHKWFGAPIMTLDSTSADNDAAAENIFRDKGHYFGVFH